jgi:hypothetical protein
MYTHTLTTEDLWFVEKGQKDSLSKTPFEVGQTVVVCDNRHVMLAEFYDGECPTCHSHNTVSFSRQNVEPGTLHSYTGECPECSEEVTILFRQCGANNPFVGKCPKCNNDLFISEKFFVEQAFILKLRKYVSRVSIALGWILGLLVFCIFALTATGIISNDNLINYSKGVIFPKMQRVYNNSLDLVASDRFYCAFILTTKEFLAGNTILLGNISVFFNICIDGLKVLGIGFWEQLRIIIGKTEELMELFGQRTQILIEILSSWVERFIS